MAIVVLSSCNVANFPDGGGHFWVYMQYAQGLLQLGCEVYWLEQFHGTGDQDRDASLLMAFFERMERYGLGGKAILYMEPPEGGGRRCYLGAEAERVFRRADLLLNFQYAIDPD